MRNLIFCIAIFTLLSCENKQDIQRLKLASTKSRILNVSLSRIYELNRLIETDSLTRSKAKLFNNFIDTVQLIQNELIETAGGFYQDGHYYILPGNEIVTDYFYGKTNLRNNSNKFFFESLDNFILRLEDLYPKSKFRQRLDIKLGFLKKLHGVNSRFEIFRELTLNEAVQLLDSF